MSKMFINACTFPSVTLWFYILFSPWRERRLKRNRKSKEKDDENGKGGKRERQKAEDEGGEE